MVRITRWFTGTPQQEFADADGRTNTVIHDERSDTPTGEKSTQSGHPASEEQVFQEGTDAACKDAVSSGATDSQKPLILITTQAGRVHYMRREAWEMAKDNGAKDVPLCQWNGEPISDDGSKKTLRISTLPKCELTPMELPNIDGLLHPEQDSGASLSL